jgi:GNAT superfamily N-acetyltransferase
MKIKKIELNNLHNIFIMSIEFYKANNFLVFDYIYNNEIVSRIECCETYDERGIDLLSIFTNFEYRGKGFATILLNNLIFYCHENNYRYILTDDVTEKEPPYNIYYKFNFKVKDDNKWTFWKKGMKVDEQRRLDLI